MGMYDYVKVKCELPDWPKGKEFVGQTKDFQSFLVTHEIREDGSLWLASEIDTDAPTSKLEPQQNYTGSMSFIDAIGNELFDYTAVWVDGKLIAIRRQ